MKKWMVTLLILLVLSLVSIYVFIPGRATFRHSDSFATNREGLYRNIFGEIAWNKWWPGISDSSKHRFVYHDYTYTIHDKQLSSLQMTIEKAGSTLASSLTIVAPGPDSVTLHWEFSQKGSLNPVARINNYNNSQQVKAELKSLMDTISSFFAINRNIYGYDIEKASVMDSNLVFTSRISKTYPSTDFIYEMVDQLRGFIHNNNGKETGHPMLNVLPKGNNNFLVRVAIPVDRKLESSGDISYKWMLGGGNILITEVKGGTHEINKAFEQVEHYVADHQRIAPAIPFLSLVTDRRTEPDSSKWVTKIYYPVM